MKKIRPLKDNIIVEIVEPERLDKLVIIRKEQFKGTVQGRVCSVGNEVKEVEVGNKILFDKLNYLDIITDVVLNKKYYVIKEKSVYLVWQEEN